MIKKLRFIGIVAAILLVTCVLLYIGVALVQYGGMLFSSHSWNEKLQSTLNKGEIYGNLSTWTLTTPNTPLDELTVQKFSDWSMVPRWSKNYNGGRFMPGLSIFVQGLDVQAVYPIDRNTICIPVRLEEDGTQFIVLTIFEREAYWNTDGIFPYLHERWSCRGEYYLYSPETDSQYFESLKVGTTLEEFMQADPLAKPELKWTRKVFCRLTEKGVYVIHFQHLSENPDDYDNYHTYQVSDVILYPYGSTNELQPYLNHTPTEYDPTDRSDWVYTMQITKVKNLDELFDEN